MRTPKYTFKFAISILICLLSTAFLSSACTTNSYEELIFDDDVTEAANLVAEANEYLNKIKIIYNQNKAKKEELKEAIKGRNKEDVQNIANELVISIDEGMSYGNKAIEKIRDAQGKKINDDFKAYLNLKQVSLQQQMDAFENYRKAAFYLLNNYDPTDDNQRKKVETKFTELDADFQKNMDSARELSKEANDLAKKSAKKQLK